MKVAYRGNFTAVDQNGACFNTECHIAASLEELGHDVVRCQEDAVPWDEQTRVANGADLFLWTQTYGLAAAWDRDHALAALDAMTVPTAGVHLDLWWGLDRADQIASEPFFRVDHLFTADGDHDADWATAGVNHHWLPPGVYGAECQPGTPRKEYRSDVAFVGSWRHYGHDEWWPHRKRLLHVLRRRYRNQLGLWPRRAAVRGRDLNDLYASVKVVVGDSCFADRSVRYFSDRAFETVGRGGFLVMPRIPGLTELLEDGVHCVYFEWGDFGGLCDLIDHYLAHDDERERIRAAGQAHVRAHHTYAHRMAQLLDTVGLGGTESEVA